MKKYLSVVMLALALASVSGISFAEEDSVGAQAGIEASFEEHHPGWGNDHGPGWPHPREHFVCEARNRRGMRFEGRDRDMRWAQRQALDNCYRYGSRECRIVHCERHW